MYTILVCDDEKDIVSALNIYLSAEGYRVLTAYDGYQALRLLDREEVHLILLDVMMPGMDGITAMTRLRQSHNLPVILLTAKSESQLRRYMTLGGGHTAPSAVTIGGVSLDDNAKTVTVDGDTVNLTPLEYDILRLLMQHPGKVFSPHEIYRRVWHEDPAADNPVAVHVRHIREKIEINPAEPRYLKVVWGKGYKMEGTAQ